MADIDELQKFFGQDFRANSLPSGRDQIEALDKKQMLHALVEATKQTKTKGKYAKGKHSFKILALIDPEKVANASPWARRFIETIKTKMDIV
ncbi:hypothetical protein AGMMS50229_11390 [Campylobacterota bacterium]|nr:hypothetical protein AGMMS50229_11390 [Campylobacterota bacterium]